MKKVKKKYLWIVPTASLVATLALGLIPRNEYVPGTLGRGLPVVWYTKWQLSDSVPQYYPLAFVVDFIYVLLFAIAAVFVAGVLRNAIHKRKQKKFSVDTTD